MAKTDRRRRHVSRGNGGWMVRRLDLGVKHWFGDARHGGREVAFEAAIARRDELERLHGPSPRTRHWREPDARSTVGLDGLSWVYTQTPSRRGNWTNAVRVVWGNPNAGTFRTRQFAITRYGLAGAVRRAARLRGEWRGLAFTEDQVAAVIEHFRARYKAVAEPEHRWLAGASEEDVALQGLRG